MASSRSLSIRSVSTEPERDLGDITGDLDTAAAAFALIRAFDGVDGDDTDRCKFRVLRVGFLGEEGETLEEESDILPPVFIRSLVVVVFVAAA